MVQKDIELILMRQLASCLGVAIFIVDPDGSLVFFNEPAEMLLGRRFEETGEMPSGELSSLFSPEDGRGMPLPSEDMPITVALRDRRPVIGRFSITSLDSVRRQVEVTAIPLIGQARRNLGAIAIIRETRVG
jgi:PAS domain-containing protein